MKRLSPFNDEMRTHTSIIHSLKLFLPCLQLLIVVIPSQGSQAASNQEMESTLDLSK